MAQLIVRDIEASVVSKLRRRAKRHRRSIQEEVREILRDATKHEVTRVRGLGTRIASRFRDVGLKPGEEIQELRGIRLQVPNFEDDSE
jgi:plasmid stability protein